MKHYLFAVVAVLLCFSPGVFAQDQPEKKKQKKTQSLKKENKSPENLENEKPGEGKTSHSDDKRFGEFDEIIIKKKSDGASSKKITIEIQDDKVLVDGKPIDSYSDEEVSVRLRNMPRFKLSGPGSSFRNDPGWSWDPQGDEQNREMAFLGVATEGSSGGARVVNVAPESPADKAGLKEGDVITKIDDQDIFDHEQLTKVITKRRPDDKVKITYKRDGKENATTATLGKRQVTRNFRVPGAPGRPPMAPNAPMAPMPPMTFDFDGRNFREFFHRDDSRPRLGLKVQDMEEGEGVKVLDVEDDSPADKAGIKENDVITSFEGEAVKSAEALAKASRGAKEKSSLKLELKRNGKAQNITIKVPKKLNTTEL